jgi:hypothetical protein
MPMSCDVSDGRDAVRLLFASGADGQRCIQTIEMGCGFVTLDSSRVIGA